MTAFDIITLFPELFRGAFDYGVIGRARKKGLIRIDVHDLRPFGKGRHRVVDDAPFGGGDGMVMMAEPIAQALENVVGENRDQTRVILTTPQGGTFDHETARRFAGYERIIIICGRYAGVDERVRQYLVDEEISIGDYILSGGEPAAVVIVDAVARLIDGVLGNEDSVVNDSFPYLLEEAQYTRPRVWKGHGVPEVLLSGDHARVARWRIENRIARTQERRPDLYKRAVRIIKKLEAAAKKKKAAGSPSRSRKNESR
jgi:tRNA (guanine37-N1)-methyltransferase